MLPAVLAFALPLASLSAPGQSSAVSGLGTPDTVQQEASRHSVATAVRVASPPIIDGRLDDGVWAEASPAEGFVQHEPREGEPATEPTEVRILYDDEALYIGAWLYDSDASGIVEGEHRRNADLSVSDAFVVVLDTFFDQQNAFVFGTTPAGIEYDGQVREEGTTPTFRMPGRGGGVNTNWDGSWEVATTRDERGWYAEFRIPFSTLRYGGTEGVWGVNFARFIRRKNERAFWAPIPRQFDLYRLTLAGVLEGLEPPTQRPLALTPYVLGSTERDFVAAGGTGYTGELGGDVKMGVTSGLTLDLTWNTDFAQVEVDEQRINLTRFDLFFPEKRPFFLENSGLFSVGAGRSVEMFFSRRIGLSDEGLPVPIVGGGRLTGRAGGLNVGALHIHTDGVDELEVAANAYSVARLVRELPNRSQVGVFAANRSGRGGERDHNRTFAADGQWGLGDAVTLEGWAATTRTPELDGREGAFSAEASYASRDWRGTVGYRQVGEDFNPEVGFLERSGFRRVQLDVLRNFRFESLPWLREYFPHIQYRAYYGFDGFQESGWIHLDPMTMEFANGALISSSVDWTREGLRAPFAIAPGVVVPPGTYDNWDFRTTWNTDASSTVSAGGRITVGGFLSGRQAQVSQNVTVRRGASVGELQLNRNQVRLAEGRFNATVARLRLAYSVRPDIFVQSLLQYSDRSDVWSANVRFGWLNAAGTGLFVVLNEARGLSDVVDPLDRDRRLVVKYTHRFDVR
jgi:hypothetical protein